MSTSCGLRHGLLAIAVSALSLAVPTVVRAQLEEISGDSANERWEEQWRLELSRGASADIVWADSALLVASLDRNVHFVDPGPDPHVVWKENFKGGFEASPVLTPRRIYLAETFRGGRLVTLDRRTREILWTANAGDLVAPPLVTDDRIYAVTSFGAVVAFESSGKEVWTTELETRVVAAPVLLDDRIVIAASDGTLFAIDPISGDLEATSDVGAGQIWGQPVVRGSGPGATVLYATLDGQVIEVSASLEVTQRRSFPSRFYASPEVVGERMYLLGHEGTLWAYNWGTSEILWQTQLERTFRASPRAGDGFVAVGDLAGRFYAVDSEDGRVLWTTRLDSAVTSKPLARGEDLYVLTERGTMFAFQRQ